MYEEFSVMFGESFRNVVDEFRKSGATLSGGDESFRQGYLLGLHRVFTLLEQAAETYNIPIEAISLDGLAEQDFLS